MTIRNANPSDLQAVAAVRAESWRDSYTDLLPEEYLTNQAGLDLERHWREKEIRKEDVVLVAENDGIVGFLAVWCRPDPCLDNLHIRPAHRSNGVGTALMRTMAKRLIRQGHQAVYLSVVTGNERAIRFYERHGGVRAGHETRLVFGHKVPNIRMECSDISTI